MIATAIIASLAIVLTFLCLLLFPKITIKGHDFSTFYWPSLLALLILLCTSLLPIQDYFSSLIKDTTMNPLEILLLFFGTAFISTVLDELGFFSYLASLAVKRAKDSQFALFIILYFLCAFLTMFTSNDIVIISFTPFILFKNQSDTIFVLRICRRQHMVDDVHLRKSDKRLSVFFLLIGFRFLFYKNVVPDFARRATVFGIIGSFVP